MGKETKVDIHCGYTELASIKKLKTLFNPKNPNSHPDEQIDEIVEIFKANGIRSPAIVSKRSGLLTKGHGRILAAEKMGLKTYPVEQQKYKSEELEYADMVADNAIQSWARLDYAMVNAEVPNLGPDFDMRILGIRDFVVEPMDKFERSEKLENVDITGEVPNENNILIITFDKEQDYLELKQKLNISSNRKVISYDEWLKHWKRVEDES